LFRMVSMKRRTRDVKPARRPRYPAITPIIMATHESLRQYCAR
jgi:hypothetical protein